MIGSKTNGDNAAAILHSKNVNEGFASNPARRASGKSPATGTGLLSTSRLLFVH